MITSSFDSYTVYSHCKGFPALLEFTRLPSGPGSARHDFCGIDVTLMGLPGNCGLSCARVIAALRTQGLVDGGNMRLLVDAYRARAAQKAPSDPPLVPCESVRSYVRDNDPLFDARLLDCALAAGILVASGKIPKAELHGRSFVGAMTSRGLYIDSEGIEHRIRRDGGPSELVTPEDLKALARARGAARDGHLVMIDELEASMNPPLSSALRATPSPAPAAPRSGGEER